MKKCKEHHPPQHYFLTCLSLLCLLIQTVKAKSPPPPPTALLTKQQFHLDTSIFFLSHTVCALQSAPNQRRRLMTIKPASNYQNSLLNLKAISFVLYPSASVPSNWLVPRVLSNSSARIERNGRPVEEDLRNEVEAKYTFLNWPIDIDAC